MLWCDVVCRQIIPEVLLPFAAARSNPNLILATTHSGGHLGWIEALNPFSAPTWVERVAAQFVWAAFKHHREEKKKNGGADIRVQPPIDSKRSD